MRFQRRQVGERVEALESRVLLAGDPYLSEFLAINDRGLVDEDGELTDWVEIANPSNSAVNLNGWYLTDNANDLTKWTLPNVAIEANGFLVINASGKDRTDPESELHANFKLNGGGEFLALVMPDAQTIISSFAPEYPRQIADVAYGLSEDQSSIGYFFIPTPGEPNIHAPAPSPDPIVINEIMYHPSSEDDAEEFIELYNPGNTAMDLHGWRLSGGIDYEFPNAVIPANSYLVIGADPNVFTAKYGDAVEVVGPWVGRLSNSSDRITLRNANDEVVDRVAYADEGDWAVRERGPADRGTEGWQWSDAHDGGGKSLELINDRFPNEYGQNWIASEPDQGTPGAVNSNAATDVAPFVVETEHSPAIPHSDTDVVVSSKIISLFGQEPNVTLQWRVDGAEEFSAALMRDNGTAGDRIAGDSVYSATIPAQPDLTVVEFFVESVGPNDTIRTWPAETKAAGQVTNALYQVMDGFDGARPFENGDAPVYFEVMTAAERQRFTDIDRRSDAQMHATFISWNSDGTKIRYNTGVRIRGSGSRGANPPNNRINIPSDDPWEGVTAININQNNVPNQVAGSALFQVLDLPAAQTKAVRLFSNGVDLYAGNFYAHVETLNSDFASHHFPTDSNGNLYKGRRPNESPPGGRGAGLVYFGEDPAPYVSYSKLSNASQADWSDVIELTRVLNESPDETYLSDLEKVANIEQWLRSLAANSVISNTEFGLLNGDRLGDDYAMYRGIEDPRFLLLPHDLDSVLSNVNWSLTRMTSVPAFNRFIYHPDIKARYFDTVQQVMRELLSEKAMIALEQSLAPLGQGRIDSAKSFLHSRADALPRIIPQGISIASNQYPLEQGFLVSQTPTIELHGSVGYEAESVTVNGKVATLFNNNTFQIGSRISTVISNSVPWRYLDDGSDQGTAWREPEFVVPDGWGEGTREFGYGDNNETTVVGFGPDPNNKFVTTYFRHEFSLADASRYLDLVLSVVRDDGVAVYVNGLEVVRNNLAEDADYQTLADRRISGGAERTFNRFPIDSGVLVDGTNVIAAEVHQASRDSADMSFWAFLQGRYIENDGVDVSPGTNSVILQVHDGPAGTGNVVDSKTLEFWYDDGDVTEVSGDLPVGDTIWSVQDSPYLVTANVVVPPEAKLTIEPGATIYFAKGTELKVHGILVADGTAQRRIRFTSDPTAPLEPDIPNQREGLPDGPPRWSGIHIENSHFAENIISHADIQFAQSLFGSIGAISSSAILDNLTFSGTHLRMIYARDASLLIQNSTFPDVFAENESPIELGLDNISEQIKILGKTPVGGQLIIRNNHFGTNKGHNDNIDADSNRRGEGPILEIIGNTFDGAGDELLDLGGDVFVSGNVFRNVFKDDETSDRGYANAISTGDAGTHTTIVVSKNLFYDIDHAINLKRNAAAIFENNTVAQVHPDFEDRFGNPNVGSVINLYVDEPNATAGIGVYASGNIFWNVPRVIGNADLPAGKVSVIQLNRNLVDADDTSVADRVESILDFGELNLEGDPRFVDESVRDYTLRSGSDAIGVNYDNDLGWLVPEGIWLLDQPNSNHAQSSANITVGGPGIFEYQFRVNGGDWSEVISIGNGFAAEGTIRTDTIELDNLSDGNYSVDVRGMDFAGNLQEGFATAEFSVQTGVSNLLIHEVLVDNRNAFLHQGTVPDVIEITNSGDQSINLKGMSISDRPDRPEKFVFTDDTLVAPGEYLLLLADNRSDLAGIHVGFGLDSDGEGVYLFGPRDAQQTRTLVDSVEFGLQIPDFSIGRMGPDMHWALTEPTLGDANQMAQTGDPSLLKINEWLAGSTSRDDFLELFNSDSLPINLSGFFMSDAPDGSPQLYEFPALSFIAGDSFLELIADRNTDAGAHHLPFGLSLDVEFITLKDTTNKTIDAISYFPQAIGISQGRLPDGSGTLEYFDLPSPGWPNGTEPPGDLDGNGMINDVDVQLLCIAIRTNDPQSSFDLNRDQNISIADMEYFLVNFFNTSFGDANLDGIFNSTDLIQIFAAGGYEDAIPLNSTWGTGDWNCDGDFTTNDLVIAFTAGRYSIAAHPVAVIQPAVAVAVQTMDDWEEAVPPDDDFAVEPGARDIDRKRPFPLRFVNSHEDRRFRRLERARDELFANPIDEWNELDIA